MRYTIIIHKRYLELCLTELKHWQVKPGSFHCNEGVIKTNDPNVVDVCLETLIDRPAFIQVLEVKRKRKQSVSH